MKSECACCSYVSEKKDIEKIYENNDLLVFLSDPPAGGHTTVLLKDHRKIEDLPPEKAAYLGSFVALVSAAIKDHYAAHAISLAHFIRPEEQQHAHFHLMPLKRVHYRDGETRKESLGTETKEQRLESAKKITKSLEKLLKNLLKKAKKPSSRRL